MTINISIPDVGPNLHPQITVLGVGGSGGNAVNNMINSNLEGVDFAIANTDAQALQISDCKKKIQLGISSTRGLGAGMRPDIGKQAAEETLNEISEMLEGSHMLFIAAGMGGGTGTGAAPVIAKLAREKGILTVGVVTKPFHFEGTQRMKLADNGINELQQYVDTLLIIPNQNLFRIANEKTTFSDAFKMADDVLYAGVRGVTDLMVQPGLINLDFYDVKTVMSEMGKAMMGTGEASGEGRAIAAAEAAIANPLIDDVSLKGAKGLIINITGGNDITLYEVDEAANRIKQEVDEDANIIYGTTCDERLEGLVRVSLVATGIDVNSVVSPKPLENLSTLSIDNSVYHQKSEYFNQDSHVKGVDIVSDDAQNYEEKLKDNNEIIENESLNNRSDTEEVIENKSLNNHSDTEKIIENESLNTRIDTEEVSDNLNNAEFDEILKVDNFISEDSNSNSSENHSIEDMPSIESDQRLSVRKLSLFDTLVDEEDINKDQLEPNNTTSSSLKFEPTFENEIESNDLVQKHSEEDQSKNDEIDLNNEFTPEENIIDEDFSQEPEEELLDIPTFLRRQAN